MKSPLRRSLLAGAAGALLFPPALAFAQSAGSEAEIAERLLATPSPLGDISLGDPAAPVTAIEYTSPTCNYSAAFIATHLPGIQRDFIETGKLRLIYREFPMDRLATGAFLLARCVPPERYVDVLELMFQQQSLWRNKNAAPQLFKIMQPFGITRAEFNRCVSDQSVQTPMLEYARRSREEFGVKATPTFFINGKVIVAQQDQDQAAVRSAIEAALVAQG